MRRWLWAALGAALLAAGLAWVRGGTRTERELTVAAASDLQPVLAELSARFRRDAGVRVVPVLAATAHLVRQLDAGAPFDLIAVADSRFLDGPARRGRIDPATRRLFAYGTLALAAPAGSGFLPRVPRDLLDPRVRTVVLAHPDHAPYGAAARDALRAAGVWDALQPRLVVAENARQAAELVRTGNADAGVLARSLCRLPGLACAPLDRSLYAPLRHELAVVAGTPRRAQALAFAALLTGPAGRVLLAAYGYDVPGEAAP